MAQAIDHGRRASNRKRGVFLLAALGLLLTLSSCIDVECPNEFGRPRERARFCGPTPP